MSTFKTSTIALITVAVAGSACATDKKNTKDFQETESVTYEHEERLGEDYSRTAVSDVETDVDEDSVEVQVERTEMVERPNATDYAMKQRLEVEADGDELDTEQSYEITMNERLPDDQIAVVPVKKNAVRMVYFDTDEATLDARDKKVLRQRAKWLKRNPNAQILIEGHADERGSDAHNFDLAHKRAMAVANYLEDLGVDTDQLEIASRGERDPFIDKKTKGAYLMNRRVEMERAAK